MSASGPSGPLVFMNNIERHIHEAINSPLGPDLPMDITIS